MDNLFNPEFTVRDLYARLCQRQRYFQRLKDTQSRQCVHCKRSESSHDPRCDISALSRKFRSETEEEEDRTEKALGLLEQLASLDPSWRW